MLREPLLHFVVLGAAVFAGHRLLAPRRDRIVVSQAFIAGLRDQARARTGRLPTPAEEEALIQGFVDEEMLYREAVALGLDRGDVIVRRRLVQKMELLTRRSAEPSEEELRQFVASHPERYQEPERVTLRHIFVGDGPLPQVTDWERQGLPFLAGRRFQLRSEKQLAEVFGPEAARSAMTLPVGGWSPLRSRYGLHLMEVEERRPPQAARVDERVKNDWLEERRAHPDAEALASLRRRYRVERP